MSERVRGYAAGKLGEPDRSPETGFNRRDRLAVELDKTGRHQLLFFHRRIWLSNRGGIGAGVCRFFVARFPIRLR